MVDHKVVSSEEWLAARKELLKQEKEFTKQREMLTAARQALPWVKIEKDYRFTGPQGSLSLADLFGDSSQLLTYHFMFGPDWDEGCKICSMLADHYDPLVVHLAHRDVTLVTVSRAPLEKIHAFKQRMGWSFTWVSSLESDFNWDFQASFKPEELESGKAYYNFESGAKFPVAEAPGISAFCKDKDGQVYHTYSAYARGLENLLGIYNFLDLVPKGRDEEGLPYPMAWVRYHDGYEDTSYVDPYV